MQRFLLGLAAIALVGAEPGGLAQSAPPRQAASADRAPRLFKDSRQQLAIARAQGRRDVVLLVSAVEGATAKVAQEAARIGGNVRYRSDDVGYLRVRVPIDRAAEFAEFDQIESAAMDRDDSYPGRLLPGDAPEPREPASDEGQLQPQAEQWPPRWSDYLLRHPYSPLKDIGASEFLKQHPTFDGRGVTIAVLDGNFDLLLPEFQTAYTSDGKRVPKVADFLNLTDPRDDADHMPQWVDLRQQVTVAGGRFTHRGKSFTAPRDGRFRVGLFDERKFNVPANAAYIDQDVDRNGNPKGDDGLFGVLWDEQSNDVWVDTNRDLSFADERAMTDYIKRQDVGVFGKDDPATPVRDSIGFTVQTDAANKFVSINLGMYQHATIIMGSVVGNREPNGRISGIAPGARLVSLMHHGIAHAMAEAIIAAARHPLVDLIVVEQHVGIATLPYVLADARHPITITTQRVIEKYRKLVFVPGSNAPGFAIVGEEGLAPSAVSVGGYQSTESYRLNTGFVPEGEDHLHWGALSHGPSGTGALKPDLLAPSGQVSTDPGYRKGRISAGLYQLPPGYTVDGGTSTATPMAAGAAALVVSAAKQMKVPHDAASLKAALTGSARHIPRLAAHEQGNGLVQVGAAFELLKKLASTKSQSAVTIVSRAPVRTTLSHLLAKPHEGVGLYEREGWNVGDQGKRTLTFTRTSGPAGPMPFDVSWQGNDGTFSSAASIALPLNIPTELPIAISAKEPGAHTAILTLTTPSVAGPAYRVLNTIVVPFRFSAENKFTVATDLVVPRPGDRPVFVEVPSGVAAITAAATAKDASVRITAVSPSRDYVSPCATLQATPEPCAIPSPEPGVWEINVSNTSDARTFDPERDQPVKPTPVKVTITLAGVDVASKSPVAQAFRPGTDAATALELTMTNRFAPVTATAASVAFGSGRAASQSIGRGEQHIYEVTVPKGTASLRGRLSDVSDPGADLDLYVLDCTVPEDKREASPPRELEKGNKSPTATPPTCTPRAKAASTHPGGTVEVSDPAPGRWVFIVDAYSLPSRRATYSFSDVFEHPRFGTIAVADTADKRAPGTSWSARALAWSASAPEAPRTLHGRVVVTSPSVRNNRSGPISLGMTELPATKPTTSPTSAGSSPKVKGN